MTGLPQGWAEAALGDVCDFENGDRGENYSGRSTFVAEGVPFINAGHFVDRRIDWTSMNFIPDQNFERLGAGKVRSGDFLYCLRGSVGKFAFLSEVEKGAVASSLIIVRPAKQLLPQFIEAYFGSPLAAGMAKHYVNGAAQPNLSAKNLAKFKLPVPPLPEQRRIVRKLDTLSARSTTARTHLTAIEKLVERYKSGVLGLELSGVPLGSEADEQNTQPISNDNERGIWTFDALPPHWDWTGFKGFLENRTDSYRKLPQKDYQSEGKHPVIDQGADLIGGYSNDDSLLLPAEPPFIIFGDHTRCVKFFEAPFVQGADGVKVFHAGKDVDIRFAYWALKGLQLPNKGYSRHAKFLKESYFPRPPLDEQREIVRRIETAFAKIDRLAAEAAKALKLLGHLDQRILAKAFAGDLVPQDPTDEPAETLLARIRDARATAPKGKRGRKSGVS